MKVGISRRYLLLVAFIVILAVIYTGGLAMAYSFQPVAADSTEVTPGVGKNILERPIRYGHLGKDVSFDFSLTTTGRSQFQLSFDNPYSYPVEIKIYSIIGNLITREEAPAGMNFKKTYNFSRDKMRLFVVEVGNEKHNLTKKITTI